MQQHQDEEAPDEERVGLVNSPTSGVVIDNGATSTGISDKQGQKQQQVSSNNKRSHRGRRRPMDHVRVLRRHYPPRGSFMLRLVCLSVLTILILTGVGFLTYLSEWNASIWGSTLPSSAGADLMPLDGASINGGAGSDVSGMETAGGASPTSSSSATTTTTNTHWVHYNPQLQSSNPFAYWNGDSGAATTSLPNPLDPMWPTLSQAETASTTTTNQPALGYLQMPHLVNNTLVFCSQGDAFITRLLPPPTSSTATPSATPHHATRLTTTVGNVVDPRLSPSQRYLAYTATYSGRRDLYLMDLARATPAVRLTYWPTSVGVRGLIGWFQGGLLFRALSDDVSLPDERLYWLQLGLEQTESAAAATATSKSDNGDDAQRFLSSTNNDTATVAPWTIEPIPFSQAREAARYQQCWYFVRIAQTSHTLRYVGGTAERIYSYCDGDAHTSALDDYKGTTKSPQMYPDSTFLFVLSDRIKTDKGGWKADRMNVWAVDLTSNEWIPITDVSCHFEGRVLQEYTVDAVTGTVVVRIGADLYTLSAATIQDKLRKGNRMDRQLSRQKNNKGTESPTFLDVANETDVNLLDDGESRWQDVNSTDAEEQDDISMDDDDDDDTSNATVWESTTDGQEIGTMDNEGMETSAAAADDVHGNVSATLEVDETNVSSHVFYQYPSIVTQARAAQDDTQDHFTGTSEELTHLPILVHSDFHTQQERMIPVNFLEHLTSADIYETPVGTKQFVMTLRGQLWVAPIVQDGRSMYHGSGRNMPERRYRIAPGASMGGSVRILAVRHVPNVEDETSDRRLAVILATDPLSSTAEHAFYLIETQSGASPLFTDWEHLPLPFLGGHVSGGSSRDGGLGSVVPDSIEVSPCGRRMAWTDKDGRILVMNMPQYQNLTAGAIASTTVLPTQNEQGQPMVGDEVELRFSPGGRYLAVTHNARNQFMIISIVDLGDPQGEDHVADIEVGRIVQATPERFNSFGPYWGKSAGDIHAFKRDTALTGVLGGEPPVDVSTTLFFLSDRDIYTAVQSPWGTRQPMPYFKRVSGMYALPLYPVNVTSQEGPFSGGAVSELRVDYVLETKKQLLASTADNKDSSSSRRRQLAEKLHVLSGVFGLVDETTFSKKASKPMVNRHLVDETEDLTVVAHFPSDMNIDFGDSGSLQFARNAYRMTQIPEANYMEILAQSPDDGSFVTIVNSGSGASVTVYNADTYPLDTFTTKDFSATGRALSMYGHSTTGDYFYLAFAPDGQCRVVPNSASGISQLLQDLELDDDIVTTAGLHLSVWPSVEYRQLYDDAWRMLRDYFYDPGMTGIDWPLIHERYLPLVSRCSKREELDDVLSQMASELSALHVFVYGGEYDDPLHGSSLLDQANSLASLGASLKRSSAWQGYEVISIPECDPDFTLIDGYSQIYSPLSEQTLRMTGQKGLQVGDVIVGVNGESVMTVPDIHMLLRGTAGTTVRLDVLRLASSNQTNDETAATEPLLVVPLRSFETDDLRYHAWEWKTRNLAEKLAEENGFSIGYVHLQDMSGPEAENAFARAFYPNYHKDAFILDVRHNRGGNIDSWVLDVLQRKAWMYWQSRDFDIDNGGLGWDEQFAFRGHIVVLIDEKTSSDGEGVSRGISELGLGRLIGTRTWGGGIWLASDNVLVDGGIATAPEIGTYNENFGWGLGIEQMGVDPDVVVDNDPFQTFHGSDKQLEAAIAELRTMLDVEPIITPTPPTKKKDMTMGNRECSAAS